MGQKNGEVISFFFLLFFFQFSHELTMPFVKTELLQHYYEKYHWTCRHLCEFLFSSVVFHDILLQLFPLCEGLLVDLIPFPAERIQAVSLISKKVMDRQNKAELLNRFKFESQQERANILEAFEAGSRK